MIRHRLDNLTRDQIEVIRAAHRDHRPATDVAAEVGCTERNIRKYYWRFSQGPGYQPKRPASGKSRAEKRPRAEPRQVTRREDRHYHSNFEPS